MAGIKSTQVGARERRAFGILAPMTGRFTENGVGALMPWNGRLYFLTYPAENGEGSGLGLWSIGPDDPRPTFERETNACDVGRLAHSPSGVDPTLVMGRTIIRKDGTLVPITGFNAADRICGYALHPLALTTKVIALTMSSSNAALSSKIYEVTLATGVAVQVADAATATSETADTMVSTSQNDGTQHFKSIHAAIATNSANSRLYVANNKHGTGTLSMVNPNNWKWTPLIPTATAAVTNGNPVSWINTGGGYMAEGGDSVFATGIDPKSLILAAFDPNSPGTAVQVRMPAPTRGYYHRFQQEWMRLRQISTERFILDAHGMWFELSPFLTQISAGTAGALPRMRALSRHYGTYPDFCMWDGHLAVAESSSSPHDTQFPDAGQPLSGVMLRDPEDVVRGGKPDGQGFWYRNEPVTAGVESTKMLVNGYDRIGVHFVNGGAASVNFDVKVYQGASTSYLERTVTVPTGTTGVHFEFNAGFGADYLTVTPSATNTTISAWVTCR